MWMRAASLALAVELCVSAAPSQTLQAGQVLEVVPTRANPTQSYALYLPSSYSADRAWPALIGFHPGARGLAIVETYREAAERFGFVVAGSNNSRNGPWDDSWRAASAMFQDLGQRVSVDARRLYLTGHSGGSRLALQIALSNPQIAGVIASSAGYPDSRPRASVSFPIFGTAGSEDFNYIEMRLLGRALKSPHRIAVFEGGHTLPPHDVAMEALAWLELRATAVGTRARDEAFVGQLWAAREQAVVAAGETAAAVHLLRAMADDFRALRDVKAVEARAAQLAKGRDVARALDAERDADDREAQALDRFARYHEGLSDAARRARSLRDMERLLSELSAQATAAEATPQRASARRVLRAVTVGAIEGRQDPQVTDLLRRHRLPAGLR